MSCFEMGPIRPPSEAQSILLRLTRNCHWNKCAFCPVYKEEPYSIRKVDEIKRDIDAMAAVADRIRRRTHGACGAGAYGAKAVDAFKGPDRDEAVDAGWIRGGRAHLCTARVACGGDRERVRRRRVPRDRHPRRPCRNRGCVRPPGARTRRTGRVACAFRRLFRSRSWGDDARGIRSGQKGLRRGFLRVVLPREPVL